ncbi:hypothetical protein AX15_003325 [Amanita polypyramis BW_CC]|nr:hypothetical protein AX15_003325 [Amanita polypyramis BW_CC]
MDIFILHLLCRVDVVFLRMVPLYPLQDYRNEESQNVLPTPLPLALPINEGVASWRFHNFDRQRLASTFQGPKLSPGRRWTRRTLVKSSLKSFRAVVGPRVEDTSPDQVRRCSLSGMGRSIQREIFACYEKITRKPPRRATTNPNALLFFAIELSRTLGTSL